MMTTHDEYRRLLHGVGLRVTGVRVAVLELLREAGSALEANEVWRRLQETHGEASTADRVTVYRTLNSFVEVGMAHRVDPGDRVFRFSLTDHAHCKDGKHDHDHPHMVCDSCGSVNCMSDTEVVLRAKRGEKLAKGTELRQQDVTLHGTCDKCDK